MNNNKKHEYFPAQLIRAWYEFYFGKKQIGEINIFYMKNISDQQHQFDNNYREPKIHLRDIFIMRTDQQNIDVFLNYYSLAESKR